ncbi:SGNH hydrolase-type esterase domain-containing protein [Chaetomidium leptoderma]|uniref:SGNH hydrolase-type esterase domain-containing protein n=1 Tax=Chaetomidium leptoderma TaxID=669021 RepID=A0AAN6VVZ9_9PEZI|nr:SGNH hydrolase-type esterase domain-containing protein [Chaetomidium leptoderma]
MMLSLPRWAAIAASLLLLSPRAIAVPTLGDVELNGGPLAARADDGWHWVATWTSMPQLVESSNMPPSPFVCTTISSTSPSGGGVFKDATLRQTLHLSVGAERLRIQISNTFGGSDLPITAASIALPTGGKAGVAGIDTSTLKALTYNNGSASITIPRGQVAYTDPIDFTVAAQANIAISIYSQAGQSGSSITGHPGSRTTSHMQSGNRVSTATLSGGANTKHWYFLSAIEAWSPPTTHALVILGDSITDGRGSTDDGNNRWPDLLIARLQQKATTNLNLSHIAVNNQAAGGNAVLSGGLGPTLLTRYKRDALQVAGVKYVMVFEGVNDIGGGGTDSGTQNGLGSRLQQAFQQIAADCKAAGLKTIGATITPFGGSGQAYSNPTREQTRVKVNEWILKSGTFDATVDFGGLIGDPSVKSQLARQYDGGDHLHPNVAGYQAMADGFPLGFFE